MDQAEIDRILQHAGDFTSGTQMYNDIINLVQEIVNLRAAVYNLQNENDCLKDLLQHEKSSLA
jgi:hypothetical protein